MSKVKITDILSRSQLAAIRHGMKGEESKWFCDKLNDMQGAVDDAPRTYEQDGAGDDAVVHFHYFMGDMDWYIIELDVESQQHQAFGYACLGDPETAELGYISIEELIANNAELDLHWTPIALRDVKAKLAAKYGVFD